MAGSSSIRVARLVVGPARPAGAPHACRVLGAAGHQLRHVQVEGLEKQRLRELLPVHAASGWVARKARSAAVRSAGLRTPAKGEF